jgi:predicted amidophosphoribosyltransferase
MLRNVSFAAFCVYAPGGAGALSARSRVICSLIKAGEPRLIMTYVARVKEQLIRAPQLAAFFDSIDAAIPVPGCMPRSSLAGSATERIAAALVSQGLAKCSWHGLRRMSAVRKSARAAIGARPSVTAHYETLGVVTPVPIADSANIVLVDDVVTKGRTLLAAAMRVHEALPAARIKAFALIRTLGFERDLARLTDPCVGEIAWGAGDAHRCP